MTPDLLLATATTTADPSSPELTWAQQNPELMLIFLVGFIFLLYYTLISAPQRRQQQERQKMLTTLHRGDRIVTIGGIHGKVVKTDDEAKIVTVQVAKGVEIDFSHAAISSVTRASEAKEGE